MRCNLDKKCQSLLTKHICTDTFLDVFPDFPEKLFFWTPLNDYRKQRPEVFCKKKCSQKFLKIHKKNLCWSLFLIKLQASDLQLYQKRNSSTVVNIVKFLKTASFYRTHLVAASDFCFKFVSFSLKTNIATVNILQKVVGSKFSF